jgi:hypothetical protein
MSEVGATSQFVRLVGGELVSSVITDTSRMRIGNLRRVSKPQMHWHFRQPRLALIWFRKGCERLRSTIDGRSVDRNLPANLILRSFRRYRRYKANGPLDRRSIIRSYFLSVPCRELNSPVVSSLPSRTWAALWAIRIGRQCIQLRGRKTDRYDNS